MLQPPTIQHQIRKHRAGPILVRRRRPRHNRRHAPQHLRTHERKHNMEPRQRLQQYHPESYALYRIQHTEPQPERATEERARHRGAHPGHPEAHARGAPQHLAPARSAEADGEDG